MASTLVPTITADSVISFEINPGTLLQFLESRAEGGPRLKCFEGSVTLVTPGMSHETRGRRLDHLILAVCLELRIKFTGLESTTWMLPFAIGGQVPDTAGITGPFPEVPTVVDPLPPSLPEPDEEPDPDPLPDPPEEPEPELEPPLLLL